MALTALLSGCAVRTARDLPPSYTQLMNHAQSSVLMGHPDVAITAYQDATAANPAKAKPWIELSQLYFKQGNYGHAIVAAREGLKRQPGNWHVDSVMTVSGLRIAFRSLKRLRSKVAARKGLAADSSVRSEARQMVQLLRDVLGEHALITGRDKRQRTPMSSVPATTPGSVASALPATTNPQPVVTSSSSHEPPETTVHAAADVSGDPFTVLKTLSSD